jgi:hypothetical protein
MKPMHPPLCSWSNGLGVLIVGIVTVLLLFIPPLLSSMPILMVNRLRVPCPLNTPTWRPIIKISEWIKRKSIKNWTHYSRP